MNLHALVKIQILAFGALFLFGQTGSAKGLDELSPDVEEPGEASPSSGEASGDEAKQMEMAKEQPMVPSEFSKSVAGKLYLATGFGFSTLAGDGGEYVAGGETDIVLGYFFGTQIAGFDLAGTYRYQPIDFTLDKDGRSYRGVLEGHYFGTAGYMKRESLTYVAQAELGVLNPYVKPLDGLESEDELEEIGVGLAIGGGVDYQVMEKVNVGGRLVIVAGSYTTVQLASAVSFMF